MTRPPELRAIIDAIERDGPYESVEEVNRILAVRMREYNSRPQRDLGGLSPDEMGQLFYGDWTSEGALRLTQSLSLDELAGAAILSDARTILEYVRDAGPVKETSAKNLPPAVVAALLPRLRIPAERRVTLAVDVPAPVNEGDVFWLPVMRQTLLFASLLARRKGLRITARGRALLDDARAGELHALLFHTLFRKVNLMVLDRSGGHRQLQSTIVFHSSSCTRPRVTGRQRRNSRSRRGWRVPRTRRANGKQRTGSDTSRSVTACWIPSCISGYSKSEFCRPKSSSSSERSTGARRSTSSSCGSSSPSGRGMIRF